MCHHLIPAQPQASPDRRSPSDGLATVQEEGREEKSMHQTPTDHPVVGGQNVDFFEDQTSLSKTGKCIWKHIKLVRSQGRTIIHSQGSGGWGGYR